MGFWVDALAIRTGATSAHPTDPEYQGRRETLFVPPAVEMIDVHLNRCVEVSNLHVALHADTGSRRSVLSWLNPAHAQLGPALLRATTPTKRMHSIHTPRCMQHRHHRDPPAKGGSLQEATVPASQAGRSWPLAKRAGSGVTCRRQGLQLLPPC